MKPVDQTAFGKPHGNCLMACVASILEVPLASLPCLHDEIVARGGEEGEWWNVLQDALAQHGWRALYCPNDRDADFPAVRPMGYTIASGLSPRDLKHAVVALDGEIVHDPHPSRAGIASVEAWYILARIGAPTRLAPDPRLYEAAA